MLETKIEGMEIKLDHIIDLLSSSSMKGAGDKTDHDPLDVDVIDERASVSYSYFGEEDDGYHDN